MLQRFSRRQQGLILALFTAGVSGFAVFFNGYGVRAWADVADPTTYTTVKNGVSAVIISLIAIALLRRPGRAASDSPSGVPKLLWLIPLVGGSIPFVLFFEGLARAQSGQAALLHKTLLVWVAAMAVVFLRERLSWPHYLAIALLIAGQISLAGGPSSIGLGLGELLILGATVLWSIEVIISKKVLSTVSPIRLSTMRMAGGALLLTVYTALRSPDINWQALTIDHVVWVGVAALFLSAYVLTWHAALDRAPAVDVTAVLVLGAVITVLLQSGFRGVVFPDPVGTSLIIIGALVVVGFAFLRHTSRT